MCWHRVMRRLLFGVLLAALVAGSPDAQTRGFEPANQEEFNRRLENMTLVGSITWEVRINFSTDGRILDDDRVVARAVYVRSDHDAGTLAFQMMPDVDPAACAADDRMTHCLVLLKFASEVTGEFVLVPGSFSAEQCADSDETIRGAWRLEK